MRSWIAQQLSRRGLLSGGIVAAGGAAITGVPPPKEPMRTTANMA